MHRWIPTSKLIAALLMLGIGGCGGGGSAPTSANQPETPLVIGTNNPTSPPSTSGASQNPGATDSPATGTDSAPAPDAAATSETISYAGAPAVWRSAEQAVTTRAMDVTALVADPSRNTVVAAAIINGQSVLVGLDPATLDTKWAIGASGVITRFALADDGSTLYGLMPDAKAVWQVDLATRAGVRVIPTADGLTPLDIAVRPGAPGTIVLSTGQPEFVSPFKRVQAYDHGVPRPRALAYTEDILNAANEVEFVSADTLVGLDNQSTGCSRQILTLTADGLATQRYRHAAECFDMRLLPVAAGQLMTSFGRTLDPVTLHDTQNFDGAAWPTGTGLYHPGLNSFLRVFGDYTSRATYYRISVEEYSAGSRRYLKRRFKAISPPITASPTFDVQGRVFAAVPIGASRLVLAAIDMHGVNAPAVTLMTVDLAAVSPLPAWEFSRRTAQSATQSSWAIRTPAVEVAYDAGQDRLIAALPVTLGPSGNALAVIKPDTGEVERVIALSGEPSRLAVSAQGSIAYVGILSTQSVQKIDLRTGASLGSIDNVLTLGLQVKPDDPHTVAVHGIDQDFVHFVKSYSNGVAAPSFVSDFTSLSLGSTQLLGTNGNDDLVAFQATSPPLMAHLRWSASGLTVSSIGSTPMAVGGKEAKMAFGRISNLLTIVDADTGTLLASMTPSSAEDFVLTSTTAGINAGRANGLRGLLLQWRTQAQQWEVTRQAALADTAFFYDEPYTMPSFELRAGAPGQTVLLANGQGGDFSKPSARLNGYIYSLRQK